MFPLIKQLYEKCLDHNDISSVTIAKEFSGILDGMQSCLPVSDSMWFLGCFTELLNRGLPTKPGDTQQVSASQLVNFSVLQLISEIIVI